MHLTESIPSKNLQKLCQRSDSLHTSSDDVISLCADVSNPRRYYIHRYTQQQQQQQQHQRCQHSGRFNKQLLNTTAINSPELATAQVAQLKWGLWVIGHSFFPGQAGQGSVFQTRCWTGQILVISYLQGISVSEHSTTGTGQARSDFWVRSEVTLEPDPTQTYWIRKFQGIIKTCK